LGLCKFFLQPHDILVVNLFVQGVLVDLVPKLLDLDLKISDLGVVLLYLKVEFVLQEGVLLDQVFFVASLAIVLVLAGPIHFFDLILQLLEHDVGPLALSLRFLGALDLDPCDVMGQTRYGLLLSGDQGTVQKLLYSALNIRLSHLALRHLHQAIGVIGQSHRQLTLEFDDALVLKHFQGLAKFFDHLHDVRLVGITDLKDGR
jgi:hypothetical protein